MRKNYLALLLFAFLLHDLPALGQLGCITRSITSNPNIGTVASPNYLVGIDANNCPATRPTANYIAISLCNTCANPVNVGTISYLGTNLPGVGLASSQVATQEVGILAAGQCKTIYYHFGWPCNPTNSDVPFTLTFQLNDSVNTSNMTFNFTKRKLIDANAGGLVTGYSVVNATVVGGYTTLTATYEFGNLPATGAVIAYHPLSDTNFNSLCYQLVKSEVIATNLASCIPLGYDLMAYVPPGGNGNVCDNAAITVKYYFKANCPGVSTSLTPMTYATSGGEIKKRIGLTNGGSIGFGSGAVVPIITKTVNKSTAAPGDTLTYSVQVCNPSLTDTTSVDQLVDVLPNSWVYAGITPASTILPSDFLSAPAIGATGALQFKAGVLMPGLYKTIVLPPNSCKTLVYKVAIPLNYTNYGVRNNAAVYKIGIYTSDTVKASVYVNKHIATPDINQTIMNMPVSGSVATNDVLLPIRTFSVIGSMSNGTLVLNANGSYTFTPVSGFTGPVEFPYTVCDNGIPQACTQATLHILISALQAPLPVILNHFDISTLDCQVNLSWTTAQEINVSHFDVERLNGANYESIGTQSAKGGNATTEYQFVDANAARGTRTYRLKMVDIDGKFAYSQTKSVNVSCTDIRLYPNPSAQQTNLSISTADEVTFSVKLVDGLGKAIYHTSLFLKNESKVISLPVEHLADGIYSVLVSDGNQLKVIRFQKTSK